MDQSKHAQEFALLEEAERGSPPVYSDAPSFARWHHSGESYPAGESGRKEQ